jgi:hypothetical protein
MFLSSSTRAIRDINGIPVLPILPDFSHMIGFCHQDGNRKRESLGSLRVILCEMCPGLTNLPHHRRFVDQSSQWLR